MSEDSADEFREAADAVYAELLDRLGEAHPERRLTATRRALDILGDPQRAFPIIHITGTNGKTSTSRIAESILRAYGLRTGLFTSPHLERFNERILLDGEPISDEALVRAWQDVKPYVELVDLELQDAGQQRLTFFEVVTVLGFAAFADAPVDVAVVEVGMGGEWDSTNAADGQIAVFTPIALDHTAILGGTVAEIARTKAGIIKPLAAVVSAAQEPAVIAELERAAELSEASLAIQPGQFDVIESTVAVGGQLISVRGLAGTYENLFLPLYGAHQAQNAATAIAAVESFLGGGTAPLNIGLLEEGLAQATSPGRLQLVGIEPTVLVDAAHNPAGAESLAAALHAFFDFDEIAVVLGILRDKDVHGVVDRLATVASRFYATQSHSERARAATDLAADIARWSDVEVAIVDDLADAVEEARAWAAAGERRAVVVTGSITLIGEVMAIAAERGWKPAKREVAE